MDVSGKKIELLAPAGNVEKLVTAIHYGADAVYLAGKNFSLRNFSGNFTLEEMAEGVRYAHAKNVNVYVAVNVYPRTAEEKTIAAFLAHLGDIGPDAVIIADPGVLMQAKTIIPQIPVHLSTQANTTSRQNVLFWANQGVARINAARELPLDEIRVLAAETPLEIEAFVHGAMCISYSGRCLLSSYMAGRDSNRGMCAHPCRWKYAVVEEQRPGRFMPLAEDDRGSYLFNSRDLCMIDHIPKMIAAGIASLKIEGRMKGMNYLAGVVKTYRQAIDTWYQSPEDYTVDRDWRDTLAGVGPRGYCTGFYLNDPEALLPDYETDTSASGFRFVGTIEKIIRLDRFLARVRNKIQTGDAIRVLCAKGPPKTFRIFEMTTENNEPLTTAQAGDRVFIQSDGPVSGMANDILQSNEDLHH
jgi:putative protease